jgi:amidohydrolase
VRGGTAPNIIPDTVQISGTLRSHHPEVREQLWTEVETALGVTRALGGDFTLDIRKGAPATINHPDVANVVRAAAREIAGNEEVVTLEPHMGGEDFSLMTNRAPGAMFLLGAKRDDVDRPHHNAYFDLDESTFKRGTAILVETACRLLREAER